MDAQSYTAQERRAANQVWAAAGAYGFEPLFLARYTDGTTDFYMNTVVGLIHKYYGDALIRSIFDAWDGDLRQTMLDDMTWLYLENAAYRLELPRRPVLEALRHAHADYFFAIQYKLSRQEWMAKNQLVYTMQAARWRRVLGRADPVMTPYESGLAAALAPEHVPEPEQLKAEILSIYAKFNLFDGTVHQRAALHLHLDGLLAKLATKAMPTQMIKTDRVTVEHSSSVDAVGGGLAVDKRRAHITLKQNAAQDRAYIESCFGRSLSPPERLRKAEQELCVGDHLGCHLWFSAGVPSPEQAPTPEAKHLAEQAELQADRNRAYYAKNRELHRSVVLRLTEQIRNCILVHQQPNARVARSGNLNAGRIWRAPLLNDDRVFLCAEEENQPSFTVDLLLDASASRLHCQEVIAAQGSILAQSLAACGIPVRVSSFSSLRGYTVLRVLKGFADKNLQNINRYFASGWNRVQVYDYMGFDHFYSETDFKNPTMYRKYISDESDFKKIEELYENRTEKDEPFYLFNVTMQNHGGFDKTYSNFHNDIQITDNHKNEQAEQYLSLVKKTDDAFKQLVEYFSKVKEPTIIVMYGDHQPAVQSSFYDSLFGKSAGSLTNEELMNKYRTPFIIWANYDIKEKTIDKMSANYLSAYVMNEAGLETSPYQKFLLKLRKKLPVLTAMGCFDKKGKYYESALESPYSDMVKEYQILQYNNLIDTKHTVNSFFYLSDEQKK